LKRLSHILKSGNLHIEGYALTLIILSWFYPFVIIIGIYYMYRLRKRIKWPFLWGLSTLFLLFMIYQTKEVLPQSVQSEVCIVDIEQGLYHDQLIILYQYKRYIVKAPKDIYQVQDIIYIKGHVTSFRKQTSPGSFDAQRYYQSKNIKGTLKPSELYKIKPGFSIYDIRSRLSDHMDAYQSKHYIKSLILGEKTFEQDQRMLYQGLNLMYLLTVSGFHVYILMLGIKKVMFYLSVSENIQSHVVTLIYIILLYLNQMTFGVLRLCVMHMCLKLNQKYGHLYTKLDLIQITFIILLVISPHFIYHQGFIMTYLILNAIHLMEIKYRGLTRYLKQLTISVIILCVLLPFNQKISLLVIGFLPGMMMFFSYILYPLSWLVLVIPELDVVLFKTTHLFEQFLTMISSKDVSFWIPKLNGLEMFVYFFLVILLFRSKKRLDYVFRTVYMIVCILSISLYRLNQDQLIFLDVGQGDASIIQSNGCITVIDSFHNVSNYLRYQGIHHIDYLVLTHNHLDHTKEANTLIEHFRVKQLVLSEYEVYSEFKPVKMIYVSQSDYFVCGNLRFDILGPMKSYTSSNNNSIVMTTVFYDQKILWTGDIEKEAENDLVRYYGHTLKSDVLKVAHHGSRTSSTKDFITFVSPKVAIISTGMDNTHQFPHPEVIQTLNNHHIIIYQTDIHGSIHFIPNSRKQKWKLMIPF